MNLNYKLTNTDFLEYQLYASSKSDMYKKRHLYSRIIIPIIYLLLGLYLANKSQNIWKGIILGGIGVLWFIVYPMYLKWRYKRHFEKHVEHNYKNRIDKFIEIFFAEDSVNTKDFMSESKINGSEIKELIEVKNHYFMKLATGVSFIIPKDAVSNPVKFKEIIANYGAEYVDELDWAWS